LQAIGLGQTSPLLVTGFSPVTPATTLLKPTVTLGGRPCDEVTAVVFPGVVGVYSVSARVPAGLSSGDHAVVLEIGGKKSQDGVKLPFSTQPGITAVANSASNIQTIVSGSWASIYGRNLSATRREWTEKDIIYDWLPTSLDDVIVTFNNVKAVVAFVSPFQLNVLVPDNLPNGPVEVTVQNSIGWQKSTATVRQYSPGLYPLQAPPGTYVVAVHSDWTYVARTELLSPLFPARPAKPGEVIIFYGTGFGPTTPAVSISQRFNGTAPLANPSALSLQIGGKPAQIKFAGLVGNGLYQINAVIPDLPDGDHEIVAVIGGESSARGRYIPVQR
jgi:uncharacterized protein (TIGR03437 family)